METMAWYLPLLIFLARICDVSIGTIRMICVINGARAAATMLGFVEVTIWALAVGGMIRYLHNPFALLGYAGGFATGTLIGMTIEQKLAVGFRTIRVINPSRDQQVAQAIRDCGYRVTQLEGSGLKGPVEIVFTTVRRREALDVLRTIEQVAPKAFVTVERADHAAGAYFLDADTRNTTRTLWQRLAELRK